MAIEACTIASFPITILEKLMEENHQICLYLIHSLARELGNSDERTVNLTQKHIRGRLAEALIFLKDNYGLEEDGYTLSIYLSREDLASMSNMTTSNAIRTLSAFATEQLIAIDGRKIKIIKEEELRKISTMG
jgi:CRP-like cAMP-binding protein